MRVSVAPVVFAAALALSVAVPPRTDDLDWHIAVGEATLAIRSVPHTNHYSYTAPATPWIHHAWGGSVLLALVDRAAGFPALVLLIALATAGSVTLVYLRSRSLAWTAVAALLLLAAHAVKPDALATLLAALLVWLLAHERRALAAPLVLVAWANLHGSFVIGLGLVAAHDLAPPAGAAATRLRRWPIRTALASVACCISPYGTRVFVPPLRYALDPSLRSFLRALGVWQVPGGAVAVVLAASTLGAVVLALRARPPRRDLVVAALAAAAAWTAVRHVALFAILAAPAVAGRIGLARAPRAAHLLGAASTVVLTATLLFTAPAAPRSPVPAALLRPPLPERLLHPFDWGGALLAAGVPVAIDARNDCYPPRVRADALAAERSDAGVRRFVRRYGVDGAVAPVGGRLDRTLRALGFHELRRAAGVVLLGR